MIVKGRLNSVSDYSFTDTSRPSDSMEKSFHETLSEAIPERKEELQIRIRTGQSGPSIAIGGKTYTMEEWKKMLGDFDQKQEDIKESLGQEIQLRQGNEANRELALRKSLDQQEREKV